MPTVGQTGDNISQGRRNVGKSATLGVTNILRACPSLAVQEQGSSRQDSVEESSSEAMELADDDVAFHVGGILVLSTWQ